MPVRLQASTPAYFSLSLGGLYHKLFSYHGTEFKRYSNIAWIYRSTSRRRDGYS